MGVFEQADNLTEDNLTGWTIYQHPEDYPKHYAVRQWWLTTQGNLVYRATAVLCETIEEAREQIPQGAILFPREDGDDPVIAETWM